MIKLASNLTWASNSNNIYFWDTNGNCSEVIINKSLKALPSLLERMVEGITRETIIQDFETKFDDIKAVLNFLIQNNIVYENGSYPEGLQSSTFSTQFERTFGLSYPIDEIYSKSVTLLGSGELSHAIQELITPLGCMFKIETDIERFESAILGSEFVIVCSDIANREIFSSINEFALTHRINWFPVIPITRSFISLGPFFCPSEKGICFTCVNQRLRSNWFEESDQQTAYMSHVEQNETALSLKDTPNYSIFFIASVVAAELAKAVSGNWPSMLSYEQLVVVDINFCTVEQHPILIVPTCPACRKTTTPYRKVWLTPMTP